MSNHELELQVKRANNCRYTISCDDCILLEDCALKFIEKCEGEK